MRTVLDSSVSAPRTGRNRAQNKIDSLRDRQSLPRIAREDGYKVGLGNSPMHIQDKQSRATKLSRQSTILMAILVVTNALAAGQEQTSRHRLWFSQYYDQSEKTLRLSESSSLHLTPQTSDGPYSTITRTEGFRWFLTSTISPAHTAGVGFLAACGTAVNRPGEYGSHWRGFGDRFGIGIAGSATGNLMEIGLGLGLGEDPRYSRAPHESLQSRVGYVARLTVLARGRDGMFGPAYARYIGIVGSNFLSNTWRVHSGANARAALLRSSQGFAGRMAANAFAEFLPDLKKSIFHRHNRTAQMNSDTRAEIPH